MQLKTYFYKAKLPPVGASFDMPAFDVAGDDMSLDTAISVARRTADREQVNAFTVEASGREVARWIKVNGEWRSDHV